MRATGEVMIDVVGHNLAFGDSATGGDVRALLGTSFETLVGSVVAAERIIEFEPVVGSVLGVDVADYSSHLGAIQLLIDCVERIIENTILGEVGRHRVLQVVAAVHAVYEVRHVVEVRRRAEQSEQQTVHVVAALRQSPARIGEREVAANREPIGQVVRRVESRRRAIVEVVRTDEHAFVVVVVAGV